MERAATVGTEPKIARDMYVPVRHASKNVNLEKTDKKRIKRAVKIMLLMPLFRTSSPEGYFKELKINEWNKGRKFLALH